MITNSFQKTLNSHFNLRIDMDEEQSIVENIRKGAELKGANLWVLIFAIIIASIGLNVNSTAVIIGAMLISPLMGPIIAIGLGLSIHEFDLIKLALKNLGFALTVSLIASTLYFLITPLNQAQTEILARTSPTIFDVFIAFSGGLAGMVALTRKVKGNVIPGVAIATALMPPLCTAGYGIASGNWHYFLGAFYLFFINCVFIFLGTFLIVRMLKFHRTVFVDNKTEAKIRMYIYSMILITVVPSGYFAYNMIHRSLTEKRINDFLISEVASKGLVIIEKKITNLDDKLQIELTALGGTVTTELKTSLNEKLSKYGLHETQITFKSLGTNNTDIGAIKSAIIEELYRNNEQVIKDKDQKIALLEKELASSKTQLVPVDAIKNELKIHIPSLESLILARVQVGEKEQLLMAYLQHNTNIPKKDLEKAKEWLKVRTQSQDIKLISEKVSKKNMLTGIK